MAIQDGTFASADLDRAYNARFQSEQDRSPFWEMWTDRSMEDELMDNEFVQADILFLEQDDGAANQVPVTARNLANFKDDYADVSEFDIGHIVHQCDKGGTNGFKMYRRQIRKAGQRGPARVNSGIVKLQNNAILSRDDAMVSYLTGLVTYTTSEPVAANLPKRTGQAAGPNGNAGAVYKVAIGTGAGDQIKLDTGKGGATFFDSFMSTLEGLQTRLIRRNQIGGVTIAGESVGEFAVLCAPEVMRAIRQTFRDKTISWNDLSVSLYRDFQAFGMAYNEEELADFSIIAHPSMPAAVAASGYTCHMMTRNALLYSVDEDNFWSTAPKDEGGVNAGPYYEYQQLFTYGYQLLNSEQYCQITIPTAASVELEGQHLDEFIANFENSNVEQADDDDDGEELAEVTTPAKRSRKS